MIFLTKRIIWNIKVQCPLEIKLSKLKMYGLDKGFTRKFIQILEWKKKLHDLSPYYKPQMYWNVGWIGNIFFFEFIM